MSLENTGCGASKDSQADRANHHRRQSNADAGNDNRGPCQSEVVYKEAEKQARRPSAEGKNRDGKGKRDTANGQEAGDVASTLTISAVTVGVEVGVTIRATDDKGNKPPGKAEHQ